VAENAQPELPFQVRPRAVLPAIAADAVQQRVRILVFQQEFADDRLQGDFLARLAELVNRLGPGVLDPGVIILRSAGIAGLGFADGHYAGFQLQFGKKSALVVELQTAVLLLQAEGRLRMGSGRSRARLQDGILRQGQVLGPDPAEGQPLDAAVGPICGNFCLGRQRPAVQSQSLRHLLGEELPFGQGQGLTEGQSDPGRVGCAKAFCGVQRWQQLCVLAQAERSQATDGECGLDSRHKMVPE